MVRENNRSKPRSCGDSQAQCISIDSLTEDVLSEFAEKIESSNIRVDKDLPLLSAPVFPQFIHSAVCQLIENAIDAMPAGGELNVTLIDGDSCWELEVADSTATTANCEHSSTLPAIGLPTIIPLDNRSKLELARRAASVHGGHVQTWDCPQGGTANILVIPRRQEIRKAA